ncbi:MAG TPA: hypothetical protein VKH46_06780 [Thermoanaerobaculia bacterium]|jgi:hypothetical protein|nr:hypothetical protein [Thermoanaerobaculia bacterium]
MKVFPVVAVLALAAAPLAAANAEPKAALPFIENDYGKALSQARAKKLPIFADAWAPW